MADDSKVSNVGGRYAQALFDLANDEKKLSAVEADLKALKKMSADSKDLRTLLASPAFSADDKGKALAALGAKAKLNPTTRKFLGLLAANGRASALSAVAAALRTALGKDPEIETRVDPALLGGIKVQVGSRLFDASLRSKLDSLKFALKRA